MQFLEMRTLRLERIEAEVGEGLLRGRGTVSSLFGQQGPKLELAFTLDSVSVEPIDNLSLTFGGTSQLGNRN